MTDLIERLRAVKWEVTDDGDRMPDDPTHKCVFVDMRPDDFRALLREAADALEAAREDAERYRWLRDREIPEWLDLWHQNPDRIDAAIDEAMEKEVSND